MAELPGDDGGFQGCQPLQLLQQDVGGLRVCVKVEFGHAEKKEIVENLNCWLKFLMSQPLRFPYWKQKQNPV